MREYLSITGGAPLLGSVRVSGAKNSALPLLMATLLTAEECRINNVPDLADIEVTMRLLRSLGAEVRYADNSMRVKAGSITRTDAPAGLVKAMRASFWILGPMIARTGAARVALPGGDAIGSRPVDLHLKGLSKLGADLRIQHGAVVASAPGGLQGANIELDFPSVGATHHLLMTASLIPEETILRGAAREPEIVELAQFLSAMGAEIEGAGSSTVRILGRSQLGGATINVLGDRIEAATYLIAGALTGGNVYVQGIEQSALAAVLDVLKKAGCSIDCSPGGIAARNTSGLKAVSFETAPFPGVATDVQPLLMAAMAAAEGQSVIRENIFESRFGHVPEYRRFGAMIEACGRVATVSGVKRLRGAIVEAGDIRAAVGLVLLALIADGLSEVYEIHHLDRGYENIVDRLRALGAAVVRVPAFDGKEVVMGC